MYYIHNLVSEDAPCTTLGGIPKFEEAPKLGGAPKLIGAPKLLL